MHICTPLLNAFCYTVTIYSVATYLTTTYVKWRDQRIKKEHNWRLYQDAKKDMEFLHTTGLMTPEWKMHQAERVLDWELVAQGWAEWKVGTDGEVHAVSTF